MMHTFMKMVSPSERRDEVIRVFKRLIGPVGVQPGCTRCCCLSDLEDKNTFLILTEWRTKADLTKHLETREFLELLTVMDLSVQTPVMEFKSISQTAGLEMVEELTSHHELPRG